MPKVSKDAWAQAEKRTGLASENAGKPGAVDRILELRRLPVVELALDEITPNPRQPRRSFDANGEGSTLERLAADIKEHSVLMPILVVERGPGQFQIVAGERRWRASALAGKLTIPARVLSQERWPRPLDDKEILALSMAENYQRKDLDPWEEAANAKQLADFGYSQREIASIMGRSQPYINQLLKGQEAAAQLAGDKSLIAPTVSPVTIAEAQRIKDETVRQEMLEKVRTGEAGLREVRAAKRRAEREAKSEETRQADERKTLLGRCLMQASLLEDTLSTIRSDAASYIEAYEELRTALTTCEGEIGRCLEALRQAAATAGG